MSGYSSITVTPDGCKSSNRDVYLSLKISSEINSLLTQSSARSNRSKAKEALLRLHDHLERFGSISEISKAVER